MPAGDGNNINQKVTSTMLPETHVIYSAAIAPTPKGDFVFSV